VNNSLACSETRAGRRPFSLAYLYLSDPWYAAADASLTDMWFQVSEVSLSAHSADSAGCVSKSDHDIEIITLKRDEHTWTRLAHALPRCRALLHNSYRVFTTLSVTASVAFGVPPPPPPTHTHTCYYTAQVPSDWSSVQFVGPQWVPLTAATAVATIALPLNYEISFTIQPTNPPIVDWSNIMHFTVRLRVCV
jgi:hypothetical protein